MQPKSDIAGNRMETLPAFAFRRLFDSSGVKLDGQVSMMSKPIEIISINIEIFVYNLQ